MLDAAESLLIDAEDREETKVPEEKIGIDYDYGDTWDKDDGEHYYPDWLALKQAIRNLRSAFFDVSNQPMYIVCEYHEMAEFPDVVGSFDKEDEATAFAETIGVDTEVYFCERIK